MSFRLLRDHDILQSSSIRQMFSNYQFALCIQTFSSIKRIKLLLNDNKYIIYMKPTVTKIKVLFNNQQPLEIVRPSETTVESLKYILRDQFAVQPELQMLHYKNPTNQIFRYLTNLNQRIGDIGNEEQTVIELNKIQWRPFGFNSMNTKVAKQVAKSTNPRSVRRIKPGLILHSKCINSTCDAYGRSTRVNLGFGKFNIGRYINRCVCPLCGQKSEKARNLGYYKCRIRIEGKKVSQEEQITPMDLVADDGMSHSFRDNGDEDFAQWEFIQVTTSQL